MSPATEQVLDVVRTHPDCRLEDLVSLCPALSWNQVFILVDNLSRSGALLLIKRGHGEYFLRAKDHTSEA